MNEFIEKIMQTLKTNGYPGKRVSLPTDKMYEAADKRELSFNKVLEKMKEDFGVNADIGPEKIVFSEIQVEAQMESPFGNMNPEEMMRQAQEMMANMDPEELRKMQEMFQNMSPEEKEDIMKKGKDLGLI